MKHTIQHINVAVDIVVFTVISGQLHILLIRRGKEPFYGEYALPGGFVEDDESLENAALRELSEETNVKNIFIKKLTAYGDVKRDPRCRIITIAFMALIDAEKFKVEAHAHHDAILAEWKHVHSVKKLAFDHNKILENALDELRYEVQTTNIAAQLLPEKFTLGELQALYETIIGESIDKRNFRKRLKALDILVATSEIKMDGAHRPALLYKFKSKRYQPLKDKIHVFV